MAVVIIPRDDRDAAEAKLQREIDDDLTVLMIVNGEGADAEAAVEMASKRAATKAPLRRVVWIPKPSVLKPATKRKFAPQGARAVAVGLDDKVAAKLSSRDAKRRLKVEQAFLKAEGQI